MSLKSVFAFIALSSLMLSSFHAYSQEPKAPADKGSFHLFIMMGEANMANSGTPVVQDYQKPDPNVLVLGSNLRWSNSVVNFGAGMGPGQVFAKHYVELHPGVTVGIIQCAKPLRSIKDFSKELTERDALYANTLEKIKFAVMYGTFKAVLWHQGESDIADTAYLDKLKSVAKDIRSDVGDPNLPFLIGEIGRFGGAPATKFNELLAGAKAAIPGSAIVSSEGLLDFGDKLNFSGFSVEVLGSRYLMEYLKMKEPELAKTFKPTLDDITKKMLAKDAEWQTILNPSFSEGESRALGWDSKWVSKGNLEVTRDVKIFASSPAALRIESTSGPVSGSISQPLRNVAGRKIKLSCKVMNAGFSGCIISLNGLDSSSKQVFQKNLINAKEAEEWNVYSVETLVPANSTNTRLLINLTGEGSIWFDDFSIEKEVLQADSTLAAVNAVSAAKEVVQTAAADNVKTDEKYDKPMEWNGIWTSKGSLKVAKDAQIFKSPPASLRIDSDNGPVDGSVSQELKGVAGKKVRVKGWVKFKGYKKCSIGIGSFDANWKLLKWGSLFYKEGVDDFDWAFFDKTVEISGNAEKVNLSLGITGEGSAWFDDIEVSLPKSESSPAKK